MPLLHRPPIHIPPARRTKIVGVKLTPAEYQRADQARGNRTLSEWARELILREIDGRSLARITLEELLGVRMLMLNLAETEDVDALVAAVDAEKKNLVGERLNGISHEPMLVMESK